MKSENVEVPVAVLATNPDSSVQFHVCQPALSDFERRRGKHLRDAVLAAATGVPGAVPLTAFDGESPAGNQLVAIHAYLKAGSAAEAKATQDWYELRDSLALSADAQAVLLEAFLRKSGLLEIFVQYSRDVFGLAEASQEEVRRAA